MNWINASGINLSFLLDRPKVKVGDTVTTEAGKALEVVAVTPLPRRKPVAAPWYRQFERRR